MWFAIMGRPLVSITGAATTAQTTDTAGDGRVRIILGNGSGAPVGPNQPLSDILAAGARIEPTTVTFYVRLGQAPTAAQLDNSPCIRSLRVSRIL
ncbi:hypothetical protein F4553_001446 [Allocatelliglobosispora scoriae]|uniref:Uncharacterized protein n=1 Tax=Allocatelliglobosispora scoriae TaxID=643052 RepID=A0A841BG53_9ACTN|nr:hypothetical protein [Allocatelliglobosispora scoriae]MBB5868067.1 hypothetical protein [Allocatelliglobosispora scoriae]